MRQPTMPKTVQAWIDTHPTYVESVEIAEDEWGGTDSPFSIWVYLKPGWILSSSETHQIHECTAREFLEQTQWIIPCNCAECQQLIREAIREDA